MFELWRPLLYYPLGLLPSVFFTLRIIIQWFQSEKKRTSYAGKTFWRLSLTGNLLLILHYFVQVQFPFALLQTANGFIACRNLSLLKKKNTLTFTQSTFFLTLSLVSTTLLFYAQSELIIGHTDWIRTPLKLWDTARHHHHIGWHILGFLGCNGYKLKKGKKAHLPPSFGG